MKPKTLKIIYWAVTILFCLVNLLSGVGSFFPNEQGTEVLKLLGYPAYFMIILGVAKILGSIAIIQTKFKEIKEWAFAGFTIDYISTSASFYFVKGEPVAIIFPMIFLAVLIVTYSLWKNVEIGKEMKNKERIK